MDKYESIYVINKNQILPMKDKKHHVANKTEVTSFVSVKLVIKKANKEYTMDRLHEI